MMTPQSVSFGDGIWLRGFRLTGKETETNMPISAPGETVRLSLYWQSDGPTAIPYTVFTHLIGPDGQLYGQWDNQPVRGTYPTTNWLPGESVVDQYQIPVSPDAPAGDYHLLVGLYDAGTGMRLPALDNKGQVIGDSAKIDKTIIMQAQ